MNYPYKQRVQKVTHVESMKELKELFAPFSSSSYNIAYMRLQEKCNGFYASISYQELVDDNETITLKGRTKLDYTIKKSQLSNYDQIKLGADLIYNDFPLTCKDSKLAKLIQERSKEEFFNSLIFIGELTVKGCHQDFNRNSSALRKKDLINSGEEFELHIFNIYSTWEDCTNLNIKAYNYLCPSVTLIDSIYTSWFNVFNSDDAQLAKIDNELKTFLANNKWEGFVIYTSDKWTPNQRTLDIIALKYPVFEEGEIIGYQYNYTSRGQIITRVNVALKNGKRIVLGSGIDDNLRALLEQGKKVYVKMKAERLSETGSYIKPVIANYWL